ncbi:MAG TPA: FAD-binding oxidoreductase [Opitutaceae bacterium]|nr:FAD-binding oxidoreductase [Opitutaceae bacterium]
MDLRTGQPVWLQDDPEDLTFSRIKHAVKCDVAVVGAGITGALVTHQLLEAGLTVAVIDKRRVGRGSTAASTGLLLYQTDTSLADLEKRHDRATARRVFYLGRRAIRELGQLTRDLSQPCGYKKRPSLYVASRPSAVATLKSEQRHLRKIDLRGAMLSREKLVRAYGFAKPAALETAGAAEINAFQLTRAVFRHHRRSKHLRVFEKTTAAKVTETPDSVVLRLANGHIIRARRVVIAAGYEAMRFVQSDLVKLHSTYVIASPPLSPEVLWPHRALMWETARPYFYLRTTADNRVVFGGRDEPFSDEKRRDKLLRRKTRELEKQFAALFPHLAFTAEFAWTGTFAETTDGLPCIGPAKPHSRVLYGLGYGGNGITFSQIAARILRDVCLGKKNRDLDLFRFDRLSKSKFYPTNHTKHTK